MATATAIPPANQGVFRKRRCGVSMGLREYSSAEFYNEVARDVRAGCGTECRKRPEQED